MVNIPFKILFLNLLKFTGIPKITGHNDTRALGRVYMAVINQKAYSFNHEIAGQFEEPGY